MATIQSTQKTVKPLTEEQLETRRAKARAYAQTLTPAQREARRAAKARYRLAHPEVDKAYDRTRVYTPEQKERRRIYGAKYRVLHRQKLLAYSAAWRAEHPEYQVAWYAAHAEEARASRVVYHATHIEEERASKVAWRLAHLEEIRAREATYRRTHPEQVRATASRRRAAKRNAPINDFTAAQWREMQAAYDHRCVYCGKRAKGHLTQDHLTPLSNGGSHTASNIVPACSPCNSRKYVGPVLIPVQPILLTLAPSRT